MYVKQPTIKNTSVKFIMFDLKISVSASLHQDRHTPIDRGCVLKDTPFVLTENVNEQPRPQ